MDKKKDFLKITISINFQDVGEPSVQLRLKIRNPDTGTVEPTVMTVSADKFRVLLSGRFIVHCMNTKQTINFKRHLGRNQKSGEKILNSLKIKGVRGNSI